MLKTALGDEMMMAIFYVVSFVKQHKHTASSIVSFVPLFVLLRFG